MFIWNKGDINEEQEKAIKEEKNVLLIACPGSGKTRTLIYKIALELSQLNSEKKYIVAITYTNAAANEIKERVELLGVDISQLWIGTIHSFCLEWIIRPYSLYLEELKNGFSILNSYDSEEILTELCKPYKANKVTHWDCGFFFESNQIQLTCTDTEKHSIIESIIEKYLQKLRENKQIDFELILDYSLTLLINKPIICEILARLFPFILIDEYQDTKEIQYHIIASILKAGGEKSRTLIVGDPNQSIYDTLGGFPMAKGDLEKMINSPLCEYSLSNNYRSSEKIINYFNFYKVYDNEIIPSGSLKHYKSLITYNNNVHKTKLIDEIVRLIDYTINEQQIKQKEICIAAPQWYPLASITRELMVKLPDYSFNGPGMAPFARDIDNFWFKLSRIVLTEPSPNMYIRRLRWSKEVLQELTDIGANVSAVSNKSLLKFCNSTSIYEVNGLNYLRKYFEQICVFLKVHIPAFKILEEHQISFFESSKKRIQRLKEEGNEAVEGIENFKKVFKQREGIKISTIHGTKGEEYDTVIVFGLLDNWVPYFKDTNGAVNSKKMLYVICSRAKKNLHLISEAGRNVNYYNPYGLQPTPHINKYKYEYDIIK